MPTRTYRHVLRRHCELCPVPGGPPLPSPVKLARQTCTATIGTGGPVCGRPAVDLDRDGRPVCALPHFQNLASHVRGVHGDPMPVAPAAQDPSSATPAPPPLAPAAQDPPDAEPEAAADAAGSDEPLTLRDARALGVVIADDVTKAVARVVKEHCDAGDAAAMAQDPTVAVHAVGLCGDGTCAPCSSQRRAEHLQARQLFADELDHAIEWRGRGKAGELLARDGSDALGDILEGWRGAGRPGPDPEPPGPSEQIEVVR